jgi:hypothetical protein
MKLITAEIRAKLLENGATTARGEDHDPHPVVKLFTPDANATWLLVEIDPEDPDLAWGLCDLGLGSPELGPVRLSEIKSVRGAAGLPVERDLHFRPTKSISAYAAEAFDRRCISV